MKTLPAKPNPRLIDTIIAKEMTFEKRWRQNFLIGPLAPLHLPSDGYHFLALTLFTTLKGWGNGVPYLADSASIPTQPTHITLDRQLPSDKAGGLVYRT